MTLFSSPNLGCNAIRWAGAALIVSGTLAQAQTVVDLGGASGFGVLAATTVTSTGPTIVDGDLGLTDGTAITGFAGYGTGGTGLVLGAFHAEDGIALQAGQGLSAAYSALSAETPTVTSVATLGNQTLTAGVYNAPIALSISGTLTLDGQGSSDAVFVFQIGSTLNTAIGTQIVLTGGATAANVFWEVGSSATFGGGTLLQGDVLADTSIVAGVGTVVDGRLLAMTGSVTLDSDTISAVPEPAATPLIFACCALVAAAAKRRFDCRRGPEASQP